MAVRDFIDENERVPLDPPNDATGDPVVAASGELDHVDVPVPGRSRHIALIVGAILVILTALAVVAAITTDAPRDVDGRSDTPATVGY